MSCATSCDAASRPRKMKALFFTDGSSSSIIRSHDKLGQRERRACQQGGCREKGPCVPDLFSYAGMESRGSGPGKCQAQDGARGREEQPAGGDKQGIHAPGKTCAV